jgi:hypothetical protein
VGPFFIAGYSGKSLPNGNHGRHQPRNFIPSSGQCGVFQALKSGIYRHWNSKTQDSGREKAGTGIA